MVLMTSIMCHYTLPTALKDYERLEYHKQHLKNLLESISDYGARVTAYFAWSLIDNFEWNLGYTVRFGLIHIDYQNNLTRYPKESAKWYKKFLTRKYKQNYFASIMNAEENNELSASVNDM